MRVDRVKLIAEMARAEMSAIKLSEISGVSRITISAIRSGKRCSKETAEKLASVLGDDILIAED